VEAHEHLAKAGMAPRLLYYGTLDGENDVRDGTSCAEGTIQYGLYIGPLRMVVMDRITQVAKRNAWPKGAWEQVRNAIDALHEKNLVFGDLREPNVLFSGGKVFLIDFDWAGKEGEARYPRRLLSQGKWPAELRKLGGQLITYDHDFCMLDKLFSW